MTGNLRLIPNNDGTYDLLIHYNRFDSEFAMDFFSKGRQGQCFENTTAFIAHHAKNIKVSAVKIMVAGVIIATLPFASFMGASAAESDTRFSMAYLYGGSVQQQIAYVERTNKALQTVSPSYFDINPDGSLKFNPVSAELVTRMHASDIKVVPFLSNHWDRTAGVNALKDVDKLSTQIANHINQYNLDGVNVDIENVTEQQRAQYSELVRQLRAKIPAHKEVSVATAANPKGWTVGWHGSYDYAALGQYADYLMMMTYDEHYEGGPAGPVASIGFVEESIKYALSKTTADKIVVGLPFFGRIWSTHDTGVIGKGLAISTIQNMIIDYQAIVTYDAATQSPKAEFEVRPGNKPYTVGGKPLAPGKYIIWFENDQSLQAKLKLIEKYNLKGAGAWALGQEDAAIWNNYNSWLNGGASAAAPGAGEIAGWVTSGTTNLNVRSAADLNSVILTQINGGTQLTILGSEINGFYPVRLSNGLLGYVSTYYITTINPTPVNPEPTPITAITSSKLQVRDTATSSGKSTGTLAKGVLVTVLGTSGNFAKISYNNLVGYVTTKDLIMTSPPPAATPPQTQPQTPPPQDLQSQDLQPQDSPSQSSPSQLQQSQPTTKITTEKIQIRETAANSGKSLGTLAKGTIVTVHSTSGNYTQISYNGVIGFVSSGSLQ
ncbi:MAG: glycosyl hydrolase family 18 protein [Peptococcaceae bacterium]|nr:glycosyl hydrolase family 18 protein [Peptococcaceae bacterium]